MNKDTLIIRDMAYRQIEIAVQVLVQNIVEIRGVSEWAAFMGYSRAHFCRKFTRRFGENPKMVFRRARFQKICREIHADWSATAYKVALEAGMQNEKSLHKFLNRNFNLGFIALKDLLKREAFRSRKILSKAAESEYKYLISKHSGSSDRATFPPGTDFQVVVGKHHNCQHLKP